jgi:hypothetical protein
MYASGIPMGMITDRKSPRLAAIIGMFALLAGYYPIKLGTIALGSTNAALIGGSI